GAFDELDIEAPGARCPRQRETRDASADDEDPRPHDLPPSRFRPHARNCSVDRSKPAVNGRLGAAPGGLSCRSQTQLDERQGGTPMSTSSTTSIGHGRVRATLAVAVLLATMVVPTATVTAADPISVTIAGSLQSEAGCPGDWDP